MKLVAQKQAPARPHERLVIHDLLRRNSAAEFAEDVRRGLTAEPKSLFPKYLYDELGSELFEAICRLDEYYLTRAESEILARYAGEIVESVPGDKTLIEMGSGSASKTREIIEALLSRQRDLLFIPVDISASALESSSRSLLQSYPRLQIEGYAADYFDGLSALGLVRRGRTLALFLGSNIGNFETSQARAFLRAIRAVLCEGDALLLGADLKKDAQILEAAYNDALGVTQAFIRNELGRINRELGGKFDLRQFSLRSKYNAAAGRVDVYLESACEQTVPIANLNLNIRLKAGERIHVENSYKYNLDELSKLAASSGFQRARTWFDSRGFFSSNLFLAVQ
jgi:dimethylhistidine N-methyltransferase